MSLFSRKPESLPAGFKYSIRVLIYQEDGEVLAHALEMDLVGCGETEEEAIEELEGLVRAQISFALQKDEKHLIHQPALQEFFDRWEEAQRNVWGEVTGDKTQKWDVVARTLVLTRDEIAEMGERKPPRFELQSLSTLA